VIKQIAHYLCKKGIYVTYFRTKTPKSLLFYGQTFGSRPSDIDLFKIKLLTETILNFLRSKCRAKLVWTLPRDDRKCSEAKLFNSQFL